MFIWNWHHLNPAGMNRFQWVYGDTPMSDLSVSRKTLVYSSSRLIQ